MTRSRIYYTILSGNQQYYCISCLGSCSYPPGQFEPKYPFSQVIADYVQVARHFAIMYKVNDHHGTPNGYNAIQALQSPYSMDLGLLADSLE